MTKRVDILEVDLEHYLLVGCTKLDMDCEKFIVPGKRGPPDRIVTPPGLPCHFVEMKTIGGKLKPWQIRDHAHRRAMGQEVFVLWTKPQIHDYLNMMKSRLDYLNAAKGV